MAISIINLDTDTRQAEKEKENRCRHQLASAEGSTEVLIDPGASPVEESLLLELELEDEDAFKVDDKLAKVSPEMKIFISLSYDG